MNQCQACGQANSGESNFCRFCGARFDHSNQQQNYDFEPPRPYVWKTDEFNVSKSEQRKTARVTFTEPQPQQFPVQNQPFQAQPLVQQKGNWAAKGYRCPRCHSQLAPRVEKKISSAGWIVFAILLITIFPLFWIGFFIKEDVWICPVCSLRVG